jgi:hypothetical protein
MFFLRINATRQGVIVVYIYGSTNPRTIDETSTLFFDLLGSSGIFWISFSLLSRRRERKGSEMEWKRA